MSAAARRSEVNKLISRGSLSKITSMIPGMSGMMEGNEDEAAAKLKRMIFITDAMRQDELDSDGLIFVRHLKLSLPLRRHDTDVTGQLRQNR